MPPLPPKIPLYVGIDPGVNGGIVGVTSCDEVFQWKMPPTRQGVINLLRELPTTYTCYAVLESVHSMPGNSGVSMFTFGQGFGVLLTCLDVFNWVYLVESPQAWQKALGVRKRGKEEKKSAWKQRLVRLANTKLKEKFTTYTADAALMAVWARQVYG